MKVKECMTKNVICVGEYESADVAARLMARYNLGSLPVRRFDGSLSGMVTDRDLVVRCMAADKAPGSVRVGERDDKAACERAGEYGHQFGGAAHGARAGPAPSRDRAGRACRAFDARGFVAG